MGIVALQQALDAAINAAGLDLVEISPHAVPPVVKIIDYKKYCYTMKKKATEARKHNRVLEIKEVKFRPNTDVNDFNIKLKKIERLLAHKNKVKATVHFRGREMTHKELGLNVLQRIEQDLLQKARIEKRPVLEGRQATMLLTPIS